MIKAIILFTLTVSILALHLGPTVLHSSAKTHLQSDQVNQLYFSNDINTILTQVDFVSRTLTTKDSTKFSLLITQCTEIKTGVTALQKSLNKYDLPINQISTLCPGVTTFNRSQIRQQIVDIEEAVNVMQDYQTRCEDCAFIRNDIDKIQNLSSTYTKLVNQTLDRHFCPQTLSLSETAKGIVNLNQSLFKNNLQSKNWYYGSTTASDYKIYMFKRSTSFNLTNCPIDTPFVRDDEQICFDCPEASVYNLGKQKCDTCQPNQILNIQSGSCDKCIGEKKVVDGTLKCFPCNFTAEEQLNMTTGKCQACGNKKYFDIPTLSCIQINCDSITPKFNKQTKQCEACSVSQIVDPNDITKCIKTNYVARCPSSTPLYDQSTFSCTACAANTFYNSATNECLGPAITNKKGV